ncbi:MAG: glycine cleavage system protein GcvH [Ornithinimicrobium sp.]
MSELEYPDNVLYSTDHEWVRERGEGIVRVGITAYAQDALGDVVYVSLPTVGDTLAKGEAVGEVESTKSVSDLYAPLNGEITAVNDALDQTPEIINTDPYEQGWMYEMRIADASALGDLMDVEAYREHIN